MKTRLRKNSFKVILVLLFFLIMIIIWAVGMGPVHIPFRKVWSIIIGTIFGKDISSIPLNTRNIVWNLRTPRVLLAMVVGGGLALSGVGMQAFTRNPLSGPYVLGISSGASAGAVIAALTHIRIFGIYSMSVGAFIGSMLTIILVYTLSGKNNGNVTPIKLILTGMAVSALFSSLTNFLIYNAKNEGGIRNVTFWMMGGLSGAKWIYLVFPLAVFVISMVIFMLIGNGLNALMLGEQTATTLGINVKKIRLIVITTTAFLTGAIVAVSGSISFVGLIIPHIVRTVMGTDHKVVVPISGILGGMFLIVADVIARTISGGSELPIGIITGLVGAPFFIWLVRRSKYSFGE